jgi:hypothetical protein
VLCWLDLSCAGMVAVRDTPAAVSAMSAQSCTNKQSELCCWWPPGSKSECCAKDCCPVQVLWLCVTPLQPCQPCLPGVMPWHLDHPARALRAGGWTTNWHSLNCWTLTQCRTKVTPTLPNGAALPLSSVNIGFRVEGLGVSGQAGQCQFGVEGSG